MELEFSAIKRFPGFTLDVTLTAHSPILVLFGPSGSGKSMTLQCLAGIIQPDVGRIVADGVVLFDSQAGVNIPPQRRRVGYVPQNYALFPHLTVAQNVAFGLRGAGQEVIRSEVGRMVELFHLHGLTDRYPRQLSGGQQQRVALARALVTRPSLLLLDEPFSALDVTLRNQLRSDLLMVQRALRVGVIFVTHDLADTYALAGEVAVYEGGKVRQCGPREEVFRHPASELVARYTGARNILPATVLAADSTRTVIRLGDFDVQAPAAPVKPGSTVKAVIRPEVVRLLAEGDRIAPDETLMTGLVATVAHQGAAYQVEVRLGWGTGPALEVAVPVWWWERHGPEVGGICQLALSGGAIHLLLE